MGNNGNGFKQAEEIYSFVNRMGQKDGSIVDSKLGIELEDHISKLNSKGQPNLLKYLSDYFLINANAYEPNDRLPDFRKLASICDLENIIQNT